MEMPVTAAWLSCARGTEREQNFFFRSRAAEEDLRPQRRPEP
jgi:hypothetical protein